MNLDPHKPIIWTNKGNINEDQLTYVHHWDVVPGEYAKFIERYYLDDEIVKESAHVYIFKGADFESLIGG